MESIKKQLIPKQFNKQELHKNADILEDFAVKKVVSTREGTITKTPINNNDISNKKYVDDAVAGGTISRSFVITNPTAASDLPLWRSPAAFTITAIHLLCKTQIIVGQLWEYDSNGLNGTTVDADITGVVDTNVNDDGALTNPSIASGNYVGWKTTSATAGATYAIITFEGHY